MQVVEDWDTDIYTKGLDLVEACIRSAAQDSSNDTRFIGRSTFAAYTHALPHKAQAFLRRMDSSLQEKLSQAVITYVPGGAALPPRLPPAPPLPALPIPPFSYPTTPTPHTPRKHIVSRNTSLRNQYHSWPGHYKSTTTPWKTLLYHLLPPPPPPPMPSILLAPTPSRPRTSGLIPELSYLTSWNVASVLHHS